MLTNFTPFSFETAIPESVGVDRAAIAKFEETVRQRGFAHQGYIIYKDGKIAASSFASPWRAEDKRHVYSVSKTWTATAIGIAVDEGLLSVEDSVISFFPELLPEKVSDNLAQMKVKHLLTMNTGHENDTFSRIATAEPQWVKRFLALPVENEPGTHFCYNTTATYMLSAILTKITDMRMSEYLRPRLFNPLGIEGVWWNESPEGIDFGGWGIHVSPEDMLKLGVLYLNKGVWNGKRILSEEWINTAASAISDNSSSEEIDWGLGYGYQIWRSQHNCFRADGAYGQYIMVDPDKNAVVVFISELGGIIGGNMQGFLDTYFDVLYPGIHKKPISMKLLECDIEVHDFMKPPAGAPEVNPQTLLLDSNKYGISRIETAPCGGGMSLKLYGGDKYASQIVCGHGKWEYNHLAHCPISPATDGLASGDVGGAAVVAAAYASDSGKVKISLAFVSTPHGMMLNIENGAVTVKDTLSECPAVASAVETT